MSNKNVRITDNADKRGDVAANIARKSDNDIETSAHNGTNPTREQIEKLVLRALLDEAYTTPKPGLVDMHDTGAHFDMNIHTFEASAHAIAPHIAHMYVLGFSWNRELPQLFAHVREIGKEAEHAMFSATGGMNTHKGSIFTLGCIATCIGYAFSHDDAPTVSHILRLCHHMTNAALEADFAVMQNHTPRTHGEKLFIQYGERGVRAQAQQGFPIIKDVAFPVLARCFQRGMEQNTRNIFALLHIMAKLHDTNVLHRASYDGLQWLQQQAAIIIADKHTLSEDDMKQVEKLNEQCIAKNISPGGAADILAASLFLLYMCGA